MQYKVDTIAHAGENWLVADFGMDSETNEHIILTTDHVRASENESEGAKADAELVCRLLNEFYTAKRLAEIAARQERLFTDSKTTD